jgi:hypothetical protein
MAFQAAISYFLNLQWFEYNREVSSGTKGWKIGFVKILESASRPPCGFWGIDDQQLEI